MPVSVATLVKRRARLDEQIRQAEERERMAEQLRKSTAQAKYLLGGLLLSQDVIPDALRTLLMDQASRRRASDQGGWEIIASRWNLDLPDLVVPSVSSGPTPPSAPLDIPASCDTVLEVSGAG